MGPTQANSLTDTPAWCTAWCTGSALLLGVAGTAHPVVEYNGARNSCSVTFLPWYFQKRLRV